MTIHDLTDLILEWMDRDGIVTELEARGFGCYDHESTRDLARALAQDGFKPCEPDALPSEFGTDGEYH